MNKKLKLHRRNPLHNHPLLSKGGVHRKTNKAKRQQEKMKMKKELLPQSKFSRI